MHSITNVVVTNTTANALLAIGASPAMVEAAEEAEAFAARGMQAAAASAHRSGTPWVMDPVAVGALGHRSEVAVALLAHRPRALRGNAPEVMALEALSAAAASRQVPAGRGVDSAHAADAALDAARHLALRTGAVVTVGGAIDLVTNGARVIRVRNGHPMMTRVTGLGCTATALIGACLAVADALADSVHGRVLVGLAGEPAAERARGPGSLQMELLDALPPRRCDGAGAGAGADRGLSADGLAAMADAPSGFLDFGCRCSRMGVMHQPSRRPRRPLPAILLAAGALLASAAGGQARQQPEPSAAVVPATAPAAAPATQPDQPVAAADRDRGGGAALDDLSPVQRHRLRALLDEPAHETPARVGRPATQAAAPAAPAAPAAATKPKGVSLAPDSLAAEVLGQVGVVQRAVALDARQFVRLFGDIGLAGRWLQRELLNPAARAALLDVTWRSAAVMLVALAAEHLLLRCLRRPLRGLGREASIADEERQSEADAADIDPPGLVQAGPASPAASPTGVMAVAPLPLAALPGSPILPARPLPDAGPAGIASTPALPDAVEAENRSRDAAHRRRTLRLFRRLPFALLRLLLKLVPLGLFLAIGNLATTLFPAAPRAQLVIIAVTNLYGAGRAGWLLVDMVLAARAPGVRLLQVGDGTARFLTRWWSWLLAIPVVAICITDVGRILDLPDRAALAIVRAVVLSEHVLLAVLIWQVRRPVAASLHPPKRLRRRSLGRLLVRVADRWWIVALFFDGALWVVWAAQIRGGYSLLLHLFLESCGVILAGRLAGIALLGGLDRLFRVEPEAGLRHPGLELRASRYYPVLRRLLTWAVTAACLVGLLQAWGVPALAFFTHGTIGRRLLSALVTILVALTVGVTVWEMANGALDRQIEHFRDSDQGSRAVRLQTLLPILRTLLLVVLGAILVLTALSEIGVDIAPLLAGAGIVGVAVGFGSQKLVQDFITGIFLLVENAMQVGDTVTVAGITGTVEHISIRTLRLRGGDGSIQIIPFSSVSTVANMSRDYAVASIGISIAFSEDTDRICGLLTGIGADLRREAAFADMILADFALNGVDSLGEYAVAISGTIRCTVGGRWPVQREFNRRLRDRMTSLGIALPQAHREILVPGLARLLADQRPATPPSPNQQDVHAHG